MPFDLTPLGNAVRQLTVALAMSREAPDGVIRGGVIQRFGYAYELSHRTLRRCLVAMEPFPEIAGRTGAARRRSGAPSRPGPCRRRSPAPFPPGADPLS